MKLNEAIHDTHWTVVLLSVHIHSTLLLGSRRMCRWKHGVESVKVTFILCPKYLNLLCNKNELNEEKSRWILKLFFITNIKRNFNEDVGKEMFSIFGNFRNAIFILNVGNRDGLCVFFVDSFWVQKGIFRKQIVTWKLTW